MTATRTSLWRMGALDLAGAIRSAEVSSQEVIETHLARIEAVNPVVNAVTVVLGEQALEAAKAADRAAGRDDDLPLLHGVSFTVKENIDLEGTPTTQGLKALANASSTRPSRIGRHGGQDRAGHAQHPDVLAFWRFMSPLLPDAMNGFLATFCEKAGHSGPEASLQSLVTRQALLRAWAEFQETRPLIVAPVCTGMPFEAGTDLDDGMVAETICGMCMSIAVNVLGLPGVAVPVGIADGLPTRSTNKEGR